MNSPVKDTLTEHVSNNNNTSVTEAEVENSNHDLSTQRSHIPDLVTYISCSSSQSCNKDIELMSTNSKVQQIHSPGIRSSDVHMTQQVRFMASQFQDQPDASQFNSGPNINSCYGNDASSSLLRGDIQLQQLCGSHVDGNKSLYSGSNHSASANFQNIDVASSPFDRVNSNNNNNNNVGSGCEILDRPDVVASESQYGHSTQHIDYQAHDKHYHQSQLPGTNGCLENTSQPCSSSFQNSPIPSSSFVPSVSSDSGFGQGQTSLGLSGLDQASLGALERATNQFTATEKMHVDEPETVYQQMGNNPIVDQYQAATERADRSLDVHMQSYNLQDFQSQSCLGAEQQGVTDHPPDNHSFNQTLNVSHTASELTAPEIASANTVGNPTIFEDSYQTPSLSNHFGDQRFQPSPVVLQTSAGLDFQGQSELSRMKEAVTDSAQFISQMTEHPSSSELPFSNPSQQTSSQFQSSQYQDSASHASVSIPESFHHSVVNTLPSSQVGSLHPGGNMDSDHYLQQLPTIPSAHLDLGFQQNSLVDMNYTSNADLTHCPDQQSLNFESSVGSTLSGSVIFSTSVPGDGQCQQKDFLTTSVNTSATQVTDPSALSRFISSDDPLLSSVVCTSVNQSSGSQSLTDYEMSSSSGLGQTLIDSSKMSTDVTMKDFSTGETLHHPSHAGFSDDSNSFSHIDIEAMVNSLNAESSAASTPQNESIISYSGFDYNSLSSASVSFSGTSQTAADAGAPFGFSDQVCSGSELPSSTATATFVSTTACEQTGGNKLDSSTFSMASAHEVARENCPQPMQVQDSEVHLPYTFHGANVNERIINNTETAMDISGGLGDKSGGMTSGISFEEIHRSIITAGNALSKEVNDAKVLDPRDIYSSSAQTVRDSLGSGPDISSVSHQGMFHTDSYDSNRAVNYSGESQEPILATTPKAVQRQDMFHNNITTNTTASGSMLSSSSDTNIFSGILPTVQDSTISSSQLQRQEQINQQSQLTIPNFLENPGSIGSHIHTSGPGNSTLAASMPQDQSQSSFILTVPSANSANSYAANSGINHTDVIEIENTSSASANGVNSQMFGSVSNSSECSVSFLDQRSCNLPSRTGSNLCTNQDFHQTDVNMPGTSLGHASSSSSDLFLRHSSLQVDSKTTALSATSSDIIKLDGNSLAAQKPGNNIILNGLSTLATPSGNPPSASASSSSSVSQPKLIVSLEDLQKLLSEQNLSHPSHSTHQQQPYTTSSSSSPQTLVLQKHASHSLKPKLLIKGSSFPNQTRGSHPNQQLLQTREKLQLLMHHSHSSEHLSSGSLSQKSTEPMPLSAFQENRQKTSNPFQFVSVNQAEQQRQQKLVLLQQNAEHPPRVQLQLKQSQLQQHQPQTVNLFLQQVPKPGEHRLQLQGQHLILSQSQRKSQTDHGISVLGEPHLQLAQKSHSTSQEPQIIQLAQNVAQKSHSSSQEPEVITLAQMQEELLTLLKQEEKAHEFEDQQLQQFHLQHQLQQAPAEKSDRPCSDNLRKDYKHLHSLLTGESTLSFGQVPNTQMKSFPSILNLSTNVQGHSALQLTSGGTPGSTVSITAPHTQAPLTQSAPFSFIPLSSSSLQFTNLAQPSSGLTTLAFVKNLSSSSVSNAFNIKDSQPEVLSSSCRPSSLHIQQTVKLENSNSVKSEQDVVGDHSSNHQASALTLTSTERKRSHTPLSIDLGSPTSDSEATSPLSPTTVCDDGNTQLTLIERSADLHIKSDSMHGIDDDDDDDENASFDMNAFHKRPSADECHSTKMKTESVPMKIAKPSVGADAHSGPSAATSEPTFDFGSMPTSATNFSFVFGNKEEASSDVFTFGLGGTTTTTTDAQLHKEGSKHSRLSTSKPAMKAAGLRSVVPTQPVRPTSRKQKEYSLKSYYPSKLDGVELKILEQPEPHHRARYQTEGSRGAIKDASQQGFPVIKLFGYKKPVNLQVFIGDECGRVKPHGFYQACRVFGKNSTACTEQEIEDTTVIEIEMLPENDMTVKLDCVGILKLRNADVERRIGPKRAREKKKTNTRARLVMRCLVDKSDVSQQMLQVVSNPIVCTQPVGQPEISRMSLTECSVLGGDSLFIIGKNFKNKGTSVLFQKLDSNDEKVVWQVEAEIEQEFFQPTHLICKIPPFKDQAAETPEVVQIVISSAGKKSDPQSFTYKPATFIKQDVAMDTDSTLPARSMPFVSPEALQLNHMVQLSNAQSSSNSSSIFQLPQGTIPTKQTTSLFSSTPSQLIRPGRLNNCISSQAPVMTPAAKASGLSPSNSLVTSSSEQTLQSFLLEDKADEIVVESSSASPAASAHLSSTVDDARVNDTVHSKPDTCSNSPLTYGTRESHQQPSDTSSAGHSQSTNKTSTPMNKPFIVVVDPAALKSSVGDEKIQQLLMHILEAQSKA